MALPGVVPSFEFNAMYVHSLQQGDPSTEEHFVSHFSPILLRKLRRKLRSTELAREVRQETFLRVLTVLRSDHGVRHPERLEIFVLGVCNNVLRETYRRQRALVQLPPEFDLAGSAPNPYACALAAETGAYVRKVLSRLSPNSREILHAVYLDEQEREDVCRRFGINRNHLRLLIHRAKKEFGDRMQKNRQSGAGPRVRGAGWSRVRGPRALKSPPVAPRSAAPGSASCPTPVFAPPLHVPDMPAQCWL